MEDVPDDERAPQAVSSAEDDSSEPPSDADAEKDDSEIQAEDAVVASTGSADVAVNDVKEDQPPEQAKPAADKEHHPEQLTGNEWVVTEGATCTFWTEVAVVSEKGLILITRQLQRPEAFDALEPQTWNLEDKSAEQRYVTVKGLPETSVFRVGFFMLTHLENSEAQKELIGTVGGQRSRKQHWWALIWNPQDGTAMVLLSACELAKAPTPAISANTDTLKEIFKSLTEDDDASLHSLRAKFSIQSASELKAGVEEKRPEETSTAIGSEGPGETGSTTRTQREPQPAREARKRTETKRLHEEAAKAGGRVTEGKEGDGKKGTAAGKGTSAGKGAGAGKRGKQGAGAKGVGGKSGKGGNGSKADKPGKHDAGKRGSGGANAWTTYMQENFARVKSEMQEEGLLNPTMIEVNARLRAAYTKPPARAAPPAPAPAGAPEAAGDRLAALEARLAAAEARKKRKREKARADYEKLHGDKAERKATKKERKEKRKKLEREQKDMERREKLLESLAKLEGERRSPARALPSAGKPAASASPSPPASVKALKRSIRGLEGAQRLDRQPAREQQIEELKYDLDERLRKRAKYGTW